MDLEQLQRKLWAAARVVPVDLHVPQGFDGRMMARLTAHSAAHSAAGSTRRQPEDAWSLWASLLWKAATVCVVVSVAVSVWTSSLEPAASPVNLETALVSMAEELSNTW